MSEEEYRKRSFTDPKFNALVNELKKFLVFKEFSVEEIHYALKFAAERHKSLLEYRKEVDELEKLGRMYD